MHVYLPLNNENIPSSNVLILCKRKNGTTYLAMRSSEPLSTNPDPSRNCYWNGLWLNSGHLEAERTGIVFNTSFSDITVESWSYLFAQDLVSKFI
jgi:hypothetical protein